MAGIGEQRSVGGSDIDGDEQLIPYGQGGAVAWVELPWDLDIDKGLEGREDVGTDLGDPLGAGLLVGGRGGAFRRVKEPLVDELGGLGHVLDAFYAGTALKDLHEVEGGGADLVSSSKGPGTDAQPDNIAYIQCIWFVFGRVREGVL